jgi:hypothetical protein
LFLPSSFQDINSRLRSEASEKAQCIWALGVGHENIRERAPNTLTVGVVIASTPILRSLGAEFRWSLRKFL